jgi:hypothetical protein
VCLAAQRQLTAAWLSLAGILFAQLNPPVFSLNTKSEPTQEAQMYVERLLPVLLQSGLGSLSMDGAMDEVGDLFVVSFIISAHVHTPCDRIPILYKSFSPAWTGYDFFSSF